VKFCKRHWQSLRDAIDARGLTPLVSQGGVAAAQRMASASQEGSRPDNFDPLMGAHNTILMHALKAAGPAVLVDNEDGTARCPLCYLTEAHKQSCTDPNCEQDFEKWIEFAADGAKTHLEWLMNGGIGQT
jgi:hypothetical protein